MKPLINVLLLVIISVPAFNQVTQKNDEPASLRWTEEKANEWYDSQAWPCGFNYIPANAISYTEMWMPYCFDPGFIDKELALAEDIGFNVLRVVLPFVVWEHDPGDFKGRLSSFLKICDKRGIKVVFTLFDDCAFGSDEKLKNPWYGQQPEVLEGWYANGWTPSPGHDMVRDSTTWPRLEKYVKDVISSFRNDPRVWVWDLYNEPTNGGLGDISLPLVKKVIAWAREADPKQPLTIAQWNGNKALNEIIFANSDIIAFHNYSDAENLRNQLQDLKKHNRPIINTEWLNRGYNSLVSTCLPVFREYNAGCMHWGLVNGKTQTHLAWGWRPGMGVPEKYQHDLFSSDHKPFHNEEIALFRDYIDLMSLRQNLVISHGPYLVDPAEDGMTVVWFTNRNCVSWVEYSGDQNFGTFPSWGGYPEIAKSSHAGLIDANTKKHVIRIKTLEPGKTYRYRINSKEILQFDPYEVLYGETIVGEISEFTTLDPDAESFSFGVVADLHGNDEILNELNAVKPLDSFDLMILNGDILSWIGDEERIFSGFLDAAVEHFASEIPFVYIRGNHETRGPGARDVMSYFPHHSGPNYYSFRQGEVYFIVLDSGEDKPDDHPVYAGLVDFDEYRSEQAGWLKEEVQKLEFRNAGYRVVVSHMPLSKDSTKHGSYDIYKKWGPILNQANIDLMINGHKHRYSRSDKFDDGYNFSTVILGKEMIMDTQVTEDKLDISVIDTEGETVDAFTIEKSRPARADDWRLGTSVGSIDKLTKDQVDQLAKAGFTDMEIGIGRIQTREDLKILKERVKEVKEWLDEKNVNIWSIHIPYGRDIDISLIDESERILAIQEVSTIIKAVRELEPEKLVIHPSFEPLPEEEREKRLEACISSLPQLVELASKYNMGLAAECLPRTCLGNTSDEILSILTRVEGLEVCCDVNHLLQETPEEFINAVGSGITTLHISDYDGLDEKHWLPGQGIINWKNVLESLETARYNGPFMFESKGTFEEKAAVWEKMKREYLGR